MTTLPEYDYEDMAAAHTIEAENKKLFRLVVAARRAFESGCLPPEEQKEIDLALEPFSSRVPYEDEQLG
jgi:hypothetical protein